MKELLLINLLIFHFTFPMHVLLQREHRLKHALDMFQHRFKNVLYVFNENNDAIPRFGLGWKSVIFSHTMLWPLQAPLHVSRFVIYNILSKWSLYFLIFWIWIFFIFLDLLTLFFSSRIFHFLILWVFQLCYILKTSLQTRLVLVSLTFFFSSSVHSLVLFSLSLYH